MEEIKYFFGLELFIFNRLWSLLYYSGEHADGGPIERMDVGRNQAVILLTGHAGRAVVLYRDGSAVRFFL